jgi:dolichol-phosphate mannosyltransferase
MAQSARESSGKAIGLSVIVPMYNEAENVADLVRALNASLAEAGRSWEIVLVNDGSTDQTEAAARTIAEADEHVRVASYTPNRGRGKALRTGFAAARGEFVAAIDADLSYEPRYILRLIEALEQNPDVDIAIGSPYMPGGGTENVPWARLWLSRLGNVVLTAAMPGNIHTITGIFRAYRRPVLESLDLESDGKEIHLEILSKALALGYRVVEVPAVLRGRKKGRSKFRFRATTLTHLAFSFFERPMLLFGGIGLMLIAIGLGFGLYLAVLWQRGTLNPGRPLFTIVVLAILGGIQLLSFGFVGTQLVALRKEVYKVQRESRLLRHELRQGNEEEIEDSAPERPERIEATSRDGSHL